MINEFKIQSASRRIKLKIIFFTVYCLLFTVYSIYSYAFLDVGLTLTSFKPYLRLQKKMQWWGYFHRDQSTAVFIIIGLLIAIFYGLLVKAFLQKKILFKNIIVLSLLICLVLLFSYPAFSHDLFNYIFNAKMVLVYHADPHHHAAWEFSDVMLGFMRNIHTAAPYFYGWTIISLLPYIFGFGRIFPQIISFKIFSTLLLFLTFFILKKIYSVYKIKHDKLRLVLFLLNPLVLIETISMGHNDLAMMAPGLLSFYYLFQFKKQKKLKFLLLAILSLAVSISTKYATIALLPLFLFWYFIPKFDIGAWGAILLFCLPFTRPLVQLHSWYLIWALTWALISKKIKLVYFFSFLSCFALLRYAPYIYFGNWDPPVQDLRLKIYFFVPLLVLWVFVLMKLQFILQKARQAKS